MKKITLLLSLLLPLLTFSQDWKFYEGQIFFKNGEVKEGLVRIPVSAKHLVGYGFNTQFKANEAADKEKFKDEEAIEKIILQHDSIQSVYKFIPIRKNKLKVFRVVNEDIYPALYSRHIIGAPATMGTSGVAPTITMGREAADEYYIYDKSFEKALPLLKFARSFRYFRKRIKKYYSNCQTLVKEMKKQDYDTEDIPELVVRASKCY